MTRAGIYVIAALMGAMQAGSAQHWGDAAADGTLLPVLALMLGMGALLLGGAMLFAAAVWAATQKGDLQ